MLRIHRSCHSRLRDVCLVSRTPCLGARSLQPTSSCNFMTAGLYPTYVCNQMACRLQYQVNERASFFVLRPSSFVLRTTKRGRDRCQAARASALFAFVFPRTCFTPHDRIQHTHNGMVTRTMWFGLLVISRMIRATSVGCQRCCNCNPTSEKIVDVLPVEI